MCSATHSPRKRTRQRTKNSHIMIMDMIMTMVDRTRKKMTSWVIQTCQPSRFWRDSPAFLPDVPRPAKSWNVPLFVRSQIFCAQFLTLPVPLTLMQIIQFNVITEIPFDFSQKYQTVPRPNRRATVYFGTQLISVGCIILKKISMWALPTVPLFAGKSRLFTRNVPLKTFSRLAGLVIDI